MLSRPTVVARYWNAPVPFTVPPITRSPMVLANGIDSPVSIDSSIALSPAMMSPSTGIRSPGRTCTTSPRMTCSTGTSTSADARITRAVFGCRCTSDRSAFDVCVFARASNMLPVSTSAMMMITAS